MTFKELLDSLTFESIDKELRSWYYKDRSEDEPLTGYIKVFDKLRSTTPVPDKMRICLSLVVWDEFENKLMDEPYVHVYGMNGKLVKELSDFEHFKEGCDEEYANSETSWGIEFTPWNEILGMSIDQEAIEKFQPAEIAAHILWEITFCGYDEEEIQGKRKDLEDSVDKIENMTEEERKKNLISLDEFKDMMDKLDKNDPISDDEDDLFD